MITDRRALKILNGTFWSPSGWNRNPTVSPGDFAYAKAQGLMFDPVALTHDEATSAAIDAAASISREAVSCAFVSSLGSRRLDLRSALGSYAIGRHMKAHRKIDDVGSRACAYCGRYDKADTDPNILNFERFKWGGVRHTDPQYIALDLTIFLSTGSIVASDEDYSVLRSIFEAVKSMPSRARLGDLERTMAKLLPSNSAERRTLIGILGYAGILIDASRPDYRRNFVPNADREQTPWSKDDWPYPVQWWNGSCGLNQSAIEEWFPGI